MGLLAISYPELGDTDLKWIQSIRSRYDPNFQLVNPHFTLVFDVDSIPRDRFISHIRSILEDTPAIRICMRTARVVHSIVDPLYYLFLVPDEGNSHIIDLHERLYTGILAEHLRHDIPYIPHITIGIFSESEPAEQIADELNRNRFEISGKISAVDIISIRNEKLEHIEKIKLGKDTE